MSAYNRLNLHVAVSLAATLFGWFNRRGNPDSHFYVRKNGQVIQYVDTKFRANADLEGNDATISVETEGGVKNANGEPWTQAQKEALAELYVWVRTTHGIPNKIAQDAKIGASSHGLSSHRLGIDGNFPPAPSVLAGRLQLGGGMHYSRSRGKLCLPTDNTEVLTEEGWVNLLDVGYNTKVASWNPETCTAVYEEPLDILEPFMSDTVSVGVFESTPDHEWYEEGSKVPAIELNSRTKHPVFISQGEGLKLSDNQIRLMVWLFADGHYMKETRTKAVTPTTIGVEWHFSKERKRSALLELLSDEGIKYSSTTQTDGTFKVRVYGDEAREKLIRLLPTKRFTKELLKISRHQLDILWETLKNTDGASTIEKMIVFGSDEQSLKFLQAATHLNGQDASMWESGGISWMIRRKTNRTVGNVVPKRSTQVSCITTRTGSLVIRQNGSTVVTGNCPGDAKLRQLAEIFQMSQKGKPVTPPKDNSSGNDLTPVTGEIAEDSWWGPATTGLAQKLAGHKVDKTVSRQPSVNKVSNLGTGWDWQKSSAKYKGGSLLIKYLQTLYKKAGFYKGKLDGWAGPQFWSAFKKAQKATTHKGAIKKFQHNLNNGKFY